MFLSHRIRYFIRSCYRHSPLKPSRWRSFYRLYFRFIFFLTIFSFLMIIYHAISIVRLDNSESNSSDIIVSLTSMPERFHYELPFAIHSLLSQKQLPKQIRIYLSPTSIIRRYDNLTLSNLKLSIQRLDSSKTLARLFDKLVNIQLEEEDYGPATKYLPIIKEFQSTSQAIMICDDDQYYHRFTISTLQEYAIQYQNSIVGLRGWRVREDLKWGVSSLDEMGYHIIQSYAIADSYRVGVITANAAYLIRSTFFHPSIYLEFNRAPDDIRYVDDIWLNGQASKQHIPRYVVPACCSHIDLTRTHVLQEYLSKNKMSRLSANSHALKWFSEDWEKYLWYRYNGKNAPNYLSWRVMIYRGWIDLLLQLKFIMHFGFL